VIILEDNMWILTLIGETSIIWIPLLIWAIVKLYNKQFKEEKRIFDREGKKIMYRDEANIILYLNKKFPLKNNSTLSYQSVMVPLPYKHCWRCKKSIYSYSVTCPSCGWRVCPSCGACYSDSCKAGNAEQERVLDEMDKIFHLQDNDSRREKFNNIISEHLRLYNIEKNKAIEEFKRLLALNPFEEDDSEQIEREIMYSRWVEKSEKDDET
jgi:hypothetical protein